MKSKNVRKVSKKPLKKRAAIPAQLRDIRFEDPKGSGIFWGFNPDGVRMKLK